MTARYSKIWTRYLIPFKNWWRLPGASRSWMQPPRCLPKKAFIAPRSKRSPAWLASPMARSYTYFARKDEVLLAVLDRLNETTERKQQFVLGDEQDLKAFFRAYLRQRMAVLWPNAEVFRAVLPELLVNSELRKRYYEQVLAPTIAVGEQFSQGAERATPDQYSTDRASHCWHLAWLTLAATLGGRGACRTVGRVAKCVDNALFRQDLVALHAQSCLKRRRCWQGKKP